MDQPTTPAEHPDQRPTVAEAVVTAPATPQSSRHSGGFIARGTGIGLAKQWRTFNLVANLVALAAAPGVWLIYRDNAGLSQLHALLATWGTLAAVRGTFDILAHRFIPWPSLFGADRSYLNEDTSLRRRIAFWRFMWKFSALLHGDLRRHPVLHGHLPRRPGELRRQRHLGASTASGRSRASGTAWPRPTARSCCSSS